VLLSMTGFGEARSQTESLAATVEVRAVNNRHLKVTVRGTEPYPMLESEIEKVVRKHVRRGTLLIHIRVERQSGSTQFVLNTGTLGTYLRQIREACDAVGAPSFVGPLLAGVLNLPGVAPESSRSASPPDEEWPVVEKTLEKAIKALDAMRRDEGRAMAAELLAQHRFIGEQVEAVREHLPTVMSGYRNRILERVRQAIVDAGVALEPQHLVREVALFADRTDVSEEILRLTSHLEQFAEIVKKGEDGAGRKLEFVVQEMGREVNTLGSKAGDVTISRHVIEIKATLEKIRELVLNVE
jgi:uncharacterized protein (TIGR00255 family)